MPVCGALFLSAALMGDSQAEERVGAGPHGGGGGRAGREAWADCGTPEPQQPRWCGDIPKWKLSPRS